MSYSLNKIKFASPSKVDLSSLDSLSRVSYSDIFSHRPAEPCVSVKTVEGHRYDFILSPKKSDKLFVVFSGYVDRKKLSPPVFQRWKWAERFPGNVLYVSDPSLYLNETLSLGWYIGTEKVDHLKNISAIVMEIANHLGVKNSGIIGYGSSGGGYASMRLADFIPEMTSIAINPQTEIKKYSKVTVNSFLRACFDKKYDDFDFSLHSSRFNLMYDANSLKEKRVILVQNTVDTNHYTNHYLPYCAMRGYDGTTPIKSEKFNTLLFEHKEGHSGTETKAVFSEIMGLL